jgi:hypothetical protein
LHLTAEHSDTPPILRPTGFEFIIDLEATKTLGVNIPPTLLAGADQAT